MRRGGDSFYTAELLELVALASYVSFVIKFFTIHQNMGQQDWQILADRCTHRDVKLINNVGSN
jgi:hypothetical protein